MKFLLNCIFVIIFLLESLEAANISCSTSSFPTFCVVENVSIPKGDPIYYVGMDSALPGISFRGTQMTKIPTLLFGNFTQLTVATFMNTGITQLTGNDLKYSAKLDNMFIYNSTLKVLKNGVFKYSTTIQILMMMENKISKVGVNTFYGANQLKYIILSSNLLTGLPTGVFRPLKSLSSVDFSYNQLIKIQKSLFGKNLMLKYISLNHNQITVVEDGAFENNKDLVSLDVSYNNLTSIYNITVGSEINLNYNLLQKLNVSSTFTNLQFIGNMVSSLSCAGSLSMKVLDGSNNYLSNMNCIKKMENLTSLSLSNNKFTQLTKAAFTKLINLEYLEIYNNLIKKLTPSVFKSLIALKQLYVDKLTVYRNLRSVLPKIEKLGVTSKTWNCTQTQSVADLVNVVNIILSFNEPDQTGFECQMKMDDINKLPIA